jgi:hypothetical protein
LASKFAIKKQGGDIHSIKGLSEDGGRAKFVENLRVPPFSEDLSN